MILLAFVAGLAIPALVGWLVIDLLEGKTPVLDRLEKWTLGYVFGVTLSMFCAFFGNVLLGVPLTVMGFLSVFCVLLILSGVPWFLAKNGRDRVTPLRHRAWESPSRAVTIALIAGGAWVGLRMILLTLTTLLTPPFFDDTMDNWNLRGKIFYYGKTFTLQFPWNGTPGVSSYPPTVPLMKTWLSLLAGGWNEGLVNSIHVIWFVALLLLVFCMLRRSLPAAWAALGTLLLASLPLEMIQGVNAYADVFLSVHLFAAAGLMVQALQNHGDERRGVSRNAPTQLRLSALAIALVPFTKNEGWALYFPVLLLLFVGTLAWCGKRRLMTQQELMRTTAVSAVMILAICVPWIGFKFVHGLAFGNAKGIDWNLTWQTGVLQAIGVNTFLEGNWGLLFPLFFGLLIVRWRSAFRSPLVVLTLLFLIPYLTQLFAYLFTGLAQEALFQTGYARGLIHLMPVIVTLTVILLHDVLHRKKAHPEI